jgi:hypothetical protein
MLSSQGHSPSARSVAADLKSARLQLVVSWRLVENKKKELPLGCRWTRPVSSHRLRSIYHEDDACIFPSDNLEAIVENLGGATTTVDALGD